MADQQSIASWFRENPGRRVTSIYLANVLSRRIDSVLSDLRALVDAGVINAKGAVTAGAYNMTTYGLNDE